MIRILTTIALFFSLAVKAESIDFDLSKINEDLLLGPGKEARLIAVGDSENPDPLIIVHGIKSNPKDMQPIIDGLRDLPFQLYILAYDDFHTRTSKNGSYLSQEIARLGKKNITIVAHSMGGLVSRKAIADLVANNTISDYDSIRLYTIDTPWHGFSGPSDDSFQMKIVNRVMPEGLIDMRAQSGFFKELNLVEFPENVSVDIVFAKEGSQANDYTETMTDPFLIHNFEVALGLTKKLSEKNQNLEYLFPRFDGNHATVLNNSKLLLYLKAEISTFKRNHLFQNY